MGGAEWAVVAGALIGSAGTIAASFAQERFLGRREHRRARREAFVEVLATSRSCIHRSRATLLALRLAREFGADVPDLGRSQGLIDLYGSSEMGEAFQDLDVSLAQLWQAIDLAILAERAAGDRYDDGDQIERVVRQRDEACDRASECLGATKSAHERLAALMHDEVGGS